MQCNEATHDRARGIRRLEPLLRHQVIETKRASLQFGGANKTKSVGRGLVMFFVEMFATRRTKRKVVAPAAVPQIARADA